jgi:hypothetical protein
MRATKAHSSIKKMAITSEATPVQKKSEATHRPVNKSTNPDLRTGVVKEILWAIIN